MSDPVETVITAFRQFAANAFNKALDQARAAKLPTQSEPDYQAAITKAKSEMATALQQLIQADTMASDHRGRTGYDAVVTLMESTRDAAKAACDQVALLVETPSGETATARSIRHGELTTLGAVLTALAGISPTPVWEKSKG